jgi:hypothetical protein
MKTKPILCLIFGSIILMGCADTGHYPISGTAIGENDPVKSMMVPNFDR